MFPSVLFSDFKSSTFVGIVKMKFTVAAVLAFAASVLAYPEMSRVERRQNQDIPAVDASIPAMSNRNGDVVPFNTAGVYQDAKAKGI